MAGHLEVDKLKQTLLVTALRFFSRKRTLTNLIPFKRYKDGNLTWQLLTDRNEEGDEFVLTVHPWTFEFPNEPNIENRYETDCTAEIHIGSVFHVNKIYLVK